MKRLAGYGTFDIAVLAAGAAVLSFGLVFAARLPTHPVTIVLVTASLALTAAGAFGLAGGAAEPRTARIERWLLLAVIVQLPLIVILPSADRDAPSPLTFPYAVGMAAALPLVASFLRWRSAGLRDQRVWALIGIHFALGAWTITAFADPRFDVHMLQELGVRYLLEGRNPWAERTYPDLYGPGSPFYGPGLVEDGFLTVGFPYPPLSLLLAVPGELIAGDYRYAQLAATAIAGALIAGTRSTQLGTAAALLLLFTPRTYFLHAFGWTEPFAAALLALVVFLAARPRLLSAALAAGALAAVKQTMLPVLVLAPVLLVRAGRASRLTFAFVSAAIVAVTTLPFALLDLPAFVESTVTFHVLQPFRVDGVTFWGWFFPNLGASVGSWPSFTVLAIVIIAVLVRCPLGPAGFSAAVAAVFFPFFLFSEYAYFNYYYFIFAALCCSVAALHPSTEGFRPIDRPQGR